MNPQTDRNKNSLLSRKKHNLHRHPLASCFIGILHNEILKEESLLNANITYHIVHKRLGSYKHNRFIQERCFTWINIK